HLTHSSWHSPDRPTYCRAPCGAWPSRAHNVPCHPCIASVQEIEHGFSIRFGLLDVRNMRRIETHKFRTLDLTLDRFAGGGWGGRVVFPDDDQSRQSDAWI